jgi:zinc transport system substrate-binding protein
MNVARVPLAALSACVLTAALTGCAALTGNDTGGAGNGVTVAAAFYPLEYVAARVAGTHAEVTDLTAPGGEPHDLELTIKETAEVAESDLVVYESGFQPAVDDAVEQNAQGDVLDASAVVDLVPFSDHGVDSSEPDPHFWQDPRRMSRLTGAVAERLTAIDPAHADAYAANAAALVRDLRQLDRQYAEGLGHCRRDTVVASHDAFGYLDRYGLRIEPILGLSPDSEATPADLSRLQDLIRSEGITTVFSETLVSRKTAESLAADTGLRTRVLDPIEGLSDATADQDYLSLMRSNLAALEEANGC